MIKNVKDLAKKSLSGFIHEGEIVHVIAVIGGWKKLDNPSLSTELKCLICGSAKHYISFCDPAVNDHKVWICAEINCMTTNRKNLLGAIYPPVTHQRAILWPLWCEINGLGDMHNDVKFELIRQSEGKLSYLLKFAQSPRGVIIMQGFPGTGKTYASIATCELFTRKSEWAMFMTQKQMSNLWLEPWKYERGEKFISNINNSTLLVIDDFGTSDIPPGFMSFFMDVINSRMQWSNRGTIITTNLDNEKFSNFCGQALNDRFNTGQKFLFEGTSRRKENIL